MIKNSNCIRNISQVSITIIMIIILYSILIDIIFGTKNEDPLIKFRSPILGDYINGWCITHYVYNFYLGYTYPDCFIEAMIAGVMWEIIEYSLSIVLIKYFPNFARKIDPELGTYWYSNHEDIIMNFLGFMSGRYLRNKIK